jgi:hypothetical protein
LASAKPGAAREVGGIKGEAAASRGGAPQGPDEVRVAQHEPGRYGAGAQEILLAIDIVETRGEQARALGEGGLQPAPFLRRQDQRDEIDLPRLVQRGRGGEQVLGDAVLAHMAPQLFSPCRLFGRGELPEAVQKSFPMRADSGLRVHHLIVLAGDRRITGGRIAASRADAFGLCRHVFRDNP